MRIVPHLLAIPLILMFVRITASHATESHPATVLACWIDIPDLPDILNPPEPALPPDPLMSVMPVTEGYMQGVEYPGTIRNKATTWAAVFEIPSSWLVSLGYVESKNQPLAENRSGATGATQIKLARARDLVTWLSHSKWQAHQKVQEILQKFWHGMRSDLLNLDLNIMLASFELHHLMRRFGNNHQLVMAAYNQGEGCISRCLKRGAPLPARAIEFITRVRRARQLGYT